MDVVYPLIRTKNDNIELLYSLRSLQFFKHDRVFIIGHKPKWIMNLIHIDYEDKKRKGSNTAEKLFIVCNDERISENFVWMMDDVYFLKQMKDIPYYKLGNFKDYFKNIKIKTSEYYKTIKGMKGNCFDTHTPIIFNKTKLRELFKKYPLCTRGSKRSLYCNEHGIEGVFGNFPDYKNNKNDKIKDCKCYNTENFKIIDGQEFISSSDDLIKSFIFKEYMYNKFDKPSQYEILNYNFIDMGKTEVLFERSLFPYRKGDIGQIRTDLAERLEAKGQVKILKMSSNKSMADKVVVETKDYSDLTKADIKVMLDKQGVTYNNKMNKETLIALLK